MATTATRQLSAAQLKHAKVKFEARRNSSSVPRDGFDDFLKRLASPDASSALPIDVDTSLDISQYYISSSHNTYLTGNQLWSKASIDPYKDVLKRGCRCIEVDVWDGGSPSNSSSDSEDNTEKAKNGQGDESDAKKLTGLVKKGLTRLRSGSNLKKSGEGNPPTDLPTSDAASTNQSLTPTPWRTQSNREEPRVLHGYTATKEISFRDVCEVVRDYAFASSEMPLIVSLEVHCCREQQEVMVELINDYWKSYLVNIPSDFSDETPLPTLESLRKKILIKVKYTPPEKKSSLTRAKSLSGANGDNDSSEDEDQVASAKKGKIIESLSRLGVYVRSCHFIGLDQPEAKIPTHVFALSEQKLIALQEQSAKALFSHNQQFLMRAYPKGTRVSSSNLDPTPFWRQGIQMVALNWQKMNAAMMMNEAMFEGTGGWVAKPEGYRRSDGRDSVGQLSKLKRISFDLSVQLLAGKNLDPASKSTPNAFVKCELHVGSKDGESIPKEGKNKGGEWKRSSAVRHSKDPDFSSDTLEFAGVEGVVPELSFVRIKVMDDDAFQKDRLIGWICFRLDRFPEGLTLFQLRGEDGKPNGSSLLVDSRFTRKE